MAELGVGVAVAGEMRLQIAEDGAEPQRLEKLTGHLRADLLQLDVGAVALERAENVPAGARAVEASAVARLLVALGRSAARPAKITIDQYRSQSDATNAVVTGKDAAMLADSPVCAYAVKQTNGQLALSGDIYDSAPYGYVLPKNRTDLAGAIAQALRALIADGTYKTILAKWGVEAGAITNPTVNPTS